MLQGDDDLTPGVIYLGHIPHGFYEDEIRGFFSQFGTINKVRLSRSKKVCSLSKRHDRFILWSKYWGEICSTLYGTRIKTKIGNIYKPLSMGHPSDVSCDVTFCY